MHVSTILVSTVAKLQSVLIFHMVVSIFLTFLQAVCPFCAVMPISFMSFINVVCLAERFWHLQISTMKYWPMFCRVFFVVSRILLVTGFLLTLSVWIRVAGHVLN
jgi:hypothetical protein